MIPVRYSILPPYCDLLLGEYADRLSSIPPLAWQSLGHYLSAPWKHRLFESLQGLSKAIPTGLFDNHGVDRILTQFFSRPGRSNDFRQLAGRLFVVATELNTGHAVAFGSPGLDDVPISAAVQASAALPGLFPPSLINGRYYVDGALIKTLHASVALQEGADLVLCINPLVPFDASMIPGGAYQSGRQWAAGGAGPDLSRHDPLPHACGDGSLPP